MKKIIISIALATSALVAAAPATAQSDRWSERRDRDDRWERSDRDDDRYDRRGDERGIVDRRFDRNGPIGQQLDRINAQIARGMQTGRISQREAVQLRSEHGNLWRLAQRYYASNGLTGWERNDLQRRIGSLQQQVRFERRDDDRRRSW